MPVEADADPGCSRTHGFRAFGEVRYESVSLSSEVVTVSRLV